jgi:hypothetical protein
LAFGTQIDGPRYHEKECGSFWGLSVGLFVEYVDWGMSERKNERERERERMGGMYSIHPSVLLGIDSTNSKIRASSQ